MTGESNIPALIMTGGADIPVYHLCHSSPGRQECMPHQLEKRPPHHEEKSVNRLNPAPVPVEFDFYIGRLFVRCQSLPGRVTLSILSQIRLIYSCHFSKPSFNRPVYQAIRRCHARKIVELGIGAGQRAMRMIEVAKLASPQQDIHYVGVDRFEDRLGIGWAGLTLKAAHQLLRSEGVRVQLVPGTPSDALVRIANSLGKIDLLIVPAEFDSESFARAWFFVPRMLHDGHLVFVERSAWRRPKTAENQATGDEIDRLASAGVVAATA